MEILAILTDSNFYNDDTIQIDNVICELSKVVY